MQKFKEQEKPNQGVVGVGVLSLHAVRYIAYLTFVILAYYVSECNYFKIVLFPNLKMLCLNLTILQPDSSDFS